MNAGSLAARLTVRTNWTAMRRILRHDRNATNKFPQRIRTGDRIHRMQHCHVTAKRRRYDAMTRGRVGRVER